MAQSRLVIAILFLSSGVLAEVAYDLCIIGAGMFGSAAARHASANPGLKICLIGLDEPSSVEEMKRRDIFSSHYDESRLIETIDPLLEIQVLTRNSIKSYRELEKLSGISFYSPLGMLSVGRKHSRWMENIEQGAAKSNQGHVVDLYSNAGFEKRFPYMKIDSSEYALFDDSGAGYINPRKMIEAQKKVALLQGCRIIHDVVQEVKDFQKGYHEIITQKYGKILAKRVLFTTGAFTNFKKFHPLPELHITVFKETVALLKISEKEAEYLSSMPSVIYSSEENDFDAYILPPVMYPDGCYYLKIGSLRADVETQALRNLESIRKWYMRQGDQNVVDRASKFLMKILPRVKVDKITGASCTVAVTPSLLPYIDRVTPTVTVAVAGNGRGAKICEEVGRLAAQLSLTGKWDSELSQRLFNAIPA